MFEMSEDMINTYKSMFRKYKARVRAIEKEGLNLNIVATSMNQLRKLGIDPFQKSLSNDDIWKLSKGTVLESFLDNQLSSAKTRRKVIKIISEKSGKKFSERSPDELSDMANFLTTDVYAVALELGILTSDIINDLYENSEVSFSDTDLEYAVSEVTSKYLQGEIKQSDVYQSIIDTLVDMIDG